VSPPPKSVENYLRPITLTSQLAKVLQGFILVSLYRQVSDSLHPKQFSVCGRSTTHALVYFLHVILEALDSESNYVNPPGYKAGPYLVCYSGK